MEKELREKIIEDYKKANDNVLEILKGRTNYLVKSTAQYLNPTIITVKTAFIDDRGELKYFTNIRDTLEKLLVEKEAPKSQYFNGAPAYIKNLLH
mgnify:CR=1 FL=1